MTKLHKINPRQDSGDPYKIGRLYRKAGAKKVMFSDGLWINEIRGLHKEFSEYFDCYFGWGTDLTNDGIIAPLSIVIKLFSVNGITTVKLGDGEGKKMGEYAQDYRTIYSV
jgi:nicotinate phosphoribosyltransferase